MNITEISVSELKEYPDNPRNIDDAVDKVAASISEFGFINPIAVTKDRYIISGHTRYRAALKLGMEKVPCVIHDISDEDARLARIIDNRTSEYSTWDALKLKSELARMSVSDQTFFRTFDGDRVSRMKDLSVRWGNAAVPCTEEEYRKVKTMFDAYVKENRTFLGFISRLVEGRLHVQN